MNKTILKTIAAGVLSIALSGCTVISPVIRDRGLDYKKSNQGAELKLPEPVAKTAKSHRYDIPKVDEKKPTVSHMPPGFGNVPW